MDTKFIRDRITQLRIQKGVSEYKMSYDLGHSRSYIYNISSGKSLPPMAEFLEICDYFGITPSQFFNDTTDNPVLLQSAIEELKKLDDDDLMQYPSAKQEQITHLLCRHSYRQEKTARHRQISPCFAAFLLYYVCITQKRRN